MDLQQRLLLLERLGEYMLSKDAKWQLAKDKAYYENGWFTPEFIELQTRTIATQYLQKKTLQTWANDYQVPEKQQRPANVGIIMAGNIPLVGFHDFLSVFVSGHKQTIKPSSKDAVLLKHLTDQLIGWNAAVSELISFAEMLKGCDAYIATGSNNSSRYFDYYFGKYPHIIRRNRTSVAILTGNETVEELSLLADDVYQYFGLGCRNVTKLYLPHEYDFVPLLETFKKYSHFFDHNKYKNNYDYQLAILIINKRYYMTNGSIIVIENPSLFSPISELHFEYYESISTIENELIGNTNIQCIVGKNHIPFGNAQKPTLTDYADGIDTLQFLCTI